MSPPPFGIAGRPIGLDHPPYVIAELSANHLGELARAHRLVDAAADAGADAVKLQTYTAEGMTLDLAGDGFAIESGPWKGQTLHELYDAAKTPWEWHAELFAHGHERGLHVFSSPFDLQSVERLVGLDAPAFKIASFEMVDHALVGRAAETERPLILSTGMARLEEVAEAVSVAREHGCRELCLLHCVSGYPTPVADANLRRIATLAERFDCVVGLSDHGLSAAVPAAAAALGARVFEKHLTLRRDEGGPDAEFSLEPHEFAELVRATRETCLALGSGAAEPGRSEQESLAFRRSLYVVRDVPAGAALSPEDVRSIRPGFGLAPKHLEAVIGRRTQKALQRGHPLAWADLEGAPA